MQLIPKASLALASLTLLGLAASSPAYATGNPIYLESSNQQLGILNPITGAYTLIGTTSDLLGGMGFGADGKLYGLGQGNGLNLYVVDTATAALTLVGNIGVSLGGYGFGATSDGTLYAHVSGTLYQINPTTAASTVIGGLGFNSSAGLNGDDQGNLFLTGATGTGFDAVNRTTGQATPIGSPNFGTAYGLADTNGILYGISTTGSIYSIDTTTGATTLAATYDVATHGSAYSAAASFAPAAVPEASTPISLGLLLCLGLGGLVVSVRQRKTQADS